MAGHLSTIRGKSAPNEKIVAAVMGVNGRGNALAKSFATIAGTGVAYICDVNRRAMENDLGGGVATAAFAEAVGR